MHYDVLTIGSSVIDAFLTLPESNTDLHLNKLEHMLCVPYGRKIEVSSCEFLLGGNATNVAVGLSRAGFRTALMAEIGEDEFAEKIINILKKEQVATEQILQSHGQSAFSIALNFKSERTLFVEHRERRHDFHFEDIQTDLLYLTSLGHEWTHVYERVSHYLQQEHKTQLAFNPGSLQIQEGLHKFAYLLPLTSVLFLNVEEAQKLLKRKEDVKELLIAFHDKGVETVVLTDGEKGSYGMDSKGTFYHQDSLRVPIVERTGAGDAYASGFLAAYLLHKTVQECMLWGTHNAASVIGKVGAEAGLLHKEELAIKQ